MKVSILNTHDNVGGAAKAMYRLHRGLQQLNVASSLIVCKKNLCDSDVSLLERNELDIQIEHAMQKYCIDANRIGVSNTFFSFNYGNLNEQLITCCAGASVINLHWIDHFISNQDLHALVKLNKPIVWTLHDQKPFTGGCHYSAGCSKYISMCESCHMLADDSFHLPARILRQKIDILKHANLTVVSPSRWLAEEAKKSALFAKVRIEVIPNAVDLNVFQQFDKYEAKLKLGINPDAVVLQFGAQNGGSTRKGFKYLLRSIDIALKNESFRTQCNKELVVVLCLGKPDKKVVDLPLKNIVMGYVDDDAEMAKIYSATDVFILPTIEDNLPNTILESMACGTQVVGFDTGGISDIVDSDCGAVVEQGNCEHLAFAIVDAVLNDEKRRHKNNVCRSVIEGRYTLKHQAKKYQNLFGDLIVHHQECKIERDHVDHDEFNNDVVEYIAGIKSKENSESVIGVVKRKLYKQLYDWKKYFKY